jgi:hypothetical protein
VSEKEERGLIEGWTYEITADKDNVSKGIFKGYAMIGSESAIVLQMPKRTRFIPVACIVHIDLLESGERKKAEEKRPEPAYYG